MKEYAFDVTVCYRVPITCSRPFMMDACVEKWHSYATSRSCSFFFCVCVCVCVCFVVVAVVELFSLFFFSGVWVGGGSIRCVVVGVILVHFESSQFVSCT